MMMTSINKKKSCVNDMCHLLLDAIRSLAYGHRTLAQMLSSADGGAVLRNSIALQRVELMMTLWNL